MTADDLTAWCADVAARFRAHEHGVTDLTADRDATLVEFVLHTLTHHDAAPVVEYIDRRRAQVTA